MIEDEIRLKSVMNLPNGRFRREWECPLISFHEVTSGFKLIQFNIRSIFFCTEIDECQSGPCQNEGSCINRINSYACSCLVGTRGFNCQISRSTKPQFASLPNIIMYVQRNIGKHVIIYRRQSLFLTSVLTPDNYINFYLNSQQYLILETFRV